MPESTSAMESVGNELAIQLAIFQKRIQQKCNCSEAEAFALICSVVIALSNNLNDEIVSKMNQTLNKIREEDVLSPNN